MKRWELEVAYGKRGRQIEGLQEQLGRQALEIGELREMVTQQAAQILALTRQVEESRRSGHRQAGRFRRDTDRLSQEPKRPGRKAGQGTWSRTTEPTDEQKAKAVTKTSHLTSCPTCKGGVTDRQIHEHFEWDIPPVTPVLTRFVSQSGHCARCQCRVRSRHPEQISEATGAAGVIIGPRAKALASDMKHHLGISYAKISGFFAVAFGLRCSRGGLYRADRRLADRASPVYAELIELVRGLAQVHVDETSWRIGTLSAWLWVFCGKGVTVYTIRTGRGHEVVLDILGRTFQGILTSDGLLTYNAAALADWLKQKCLAHILRGLKELSASQQEAHLVVAKALTTLLRDALSLGRQRSELDVAAYAEEATKIERRLDTLLAEHASDADNDAARMIRHLTKHRPHLLGFLYAEGIAPTNNYAEREIRPAVITRKVGGCNRSPEGAHAHAVLASIGATCRHRRIPVIDFLVQLQRTPVGSSSIVAATPAG